jgi:hypothetical protein
LTVAYSDRDESDIIELATELLRNEAWAERFSEQYLAEALQELAATFVRSDDIPAFRDAAAKKLTALKEFSDRHISIFPVQGLILGPPLIRFGHVILRKKTRGVAGQLGRDWGSGQSQYKHFAKEMKVMSGNWATFAAVESVAEPTRAMEVGVEEVQKVLDLITFGLFRTGKLPSSTPHSVPGESVGQPPWCVTLSSSGDSVRMALHSQSSHFLAYRLERTTMMELRLLPEYASLLQLIASRTGLTAMESILVRALHWFTDSLRQKSKELQLLGMFIALEAVLSRGKGQTIGRQVAESAAFLSSSRGPQLRAIFEELTTLYRLRGKIAHGEHEYVSDDSLMKLRHRVGEVICRALAMRDRLRSRNDLHDWIEKQKFG